MDNGLVQSAQGDAAFSASVVCNRGIEIAGSHHNVYTFECFDRHGKLKWREEVHNLVTNEGLNDVLSKYFKASGYTATWYVGLIDNVNFTAIAAGNTAAGITLNASGANQWQEFDDFSETNRQTLTLGAVASQSVDNSASKAAHNITATGTVKGAFVVSTNIKGGTTGVLYGAAAFAANRAVEIGDVLNLSVALTQASV